MSDQLRVLIVDDHPVFRDGLRAAISVDADLILVGEAGTGVEAVEMTQRLRPELVVMDIHMPDINGIEATRQIVNQAPGTNILIVTMYEDDASVFAAMRAGARGYVLKGVRSAELLRAIRSVGVGEAVFSPVIATRLTEYFASMQATSPRQQPFPELSNRERQVLELIAHGHRNAEIADQLYLSPKTVRNHITSIFDKLQLADRTEAIARARDAGLGA